MTQSPDKTATDATTEHVGDGVTENRKRKERDDAAPGADALVPKGEDLGGNEEDEEEHVVTLSDVIQEDAELSETADAVLGDASETNCSFPMGYYRQALYACLTCTPPSATNAAGICLACSYHCHADHELVELYTKRSFKCDCGNSKFPKDNPCKLFADKPPVNDQNKYSQNFFGTYCTCHRPYPDPERTTPEVMVQCVICEDWLHEEHVFPSEGDAASSVEKPPLPEDYDEMICAACVKKHPFLLAYVEQEEAQDGKEEEVSEQSETTDKENEEDTCFLTSKATLIDASKARPTFWLRGWRESLCQCKDCVRRYEVSQLTFLLDPEDSLQEYEEKAKQQRSASTEEAAQKAFQTTLSHEQQVEMAMGYNHMKQSLQQYLAKFAQEGKTVRAEDIKSFFEELRQTKRPRTEEN